MSKDELRDQLFAKYFEIEDGILATDLVEKLAFIPETYNYLHNLLEKNVRYFDSYSYIRSIKEISQYLIIKLGPCNYIIIDTQKMASLSEEEVAMCFSEQFFIAEFCERPLGSDYSYLDLYHFETYEGEIAELLDFFEQNREVLILPTYLCYKITLGDAFTSFSIDFANSSAQVCFQTPDQFLYEQLFLRYDLSPSRMQDAVSRIGLEHIKAMFESIKNIKIPKTSIPSELYSLYLKVNEKKKNLKYPKDNT